MGPQMFWSNILRPFRRLLAPFVSLSPGGCDGQFFPYGGRNCPGRGRADALCPFARVSSTGRIFRPPQEADCARSPASPQRREGARFLSSRDASTHYGTDMFVGAVEGTPGR